MKVGRSAMEPPDRESVERLADYDGCVLAEAIESLDLRLRNDGFSRPLRRFGGAAAVVAGFAIPIRVRCVSPPPTTHDYPERTDWWKYILSCPHPRVLAVQDVDSPHGGGAFLDAAMARVVAALGCVAAIVDGAVRDAPELARTPLRVFASRLGISRAYAHVVRFGEPVVIAGLAVAAGDVLHGDEHGFQTVPRAALAALPGAAEAAIAKRLELERACAEEPLSLERLHDAVERLHQR